MIRRTAFWLILGIALLAAGVILLGVIAALGIVVFLVGMAVLMVLSVVAMRNSGRAKANYFYRGGSASEKVDLGNNAQEVPADIWDQVTENKGETK